MSTNVIYLANTSGHSRTMAIGMTAQDNILASGSTINVYAPYMSYNYTQGASSSIDGSSLVYTSFRTVPDAFSGGYNNGTYSSGVPGKDTNAGTSYSLDYEWGILSCNTSDLFNASNASTKSIGLIYNCSVNASVYSSSGHLSSWDYLDVSLGTLTTVTLSAPPTFTVSNTTVDTPTYKSYGTNIHSNITVNVSNPTAQYGGYVTSIKLIVGSQNQELTYGPSNQPSATTSLSLTFEEKGTFTPTVTVTDSRGQQTTQTLDPVTVEEYLLPTASIGNIYRINAQGKDDEEGTYIRASVKFDYDDNWVKLTTPTVRLLNSSGEAVSGWSLVKWYRSRTSDPPNQWIGFNWSTVTKNQTVGVCIQLPSSNSSSGYTIEITPKATINTETHTGSPTTAFIQPAFFTIDFLAGGKGIAFGGPVSQDGFWDYMDTYFMTDIFMNLDSTQASGTDHDLLTAISNLGWTSDVTSST